MLTFVILTNVSIGSLTVSAFPVRQGASPRPGIYTVTSVAPSPGLGRTVSAVPGFASLTLGYFPPPLRGPGESRRP